MSGNNSPEQRKALQESLQATMREIDAQTSYFQQAIATHETAIARYKKIMLDHPGLSHFMAAEIKDENDNIKKLYQEIAVKDSYKHYYQTLFEANNPAVNAAGP